MQLPLPVLADRVAALPHARAVAVEITAPGRVTSGFSSVHHLLRLLIALLHLGLECAERYDVRSSQHDPGNERRRNCRCAPEPSLRFSSSVIAGGRLGLGVARVRISYLSISRLTV